MKKAVITALRKTRATRARYDWPIKVTAAIARPIHPDEAPVALQFRDRFFQEDGVDAIFDFIIVAGESAFHAPWVFHSIRWWREHLTENKPRFHWPPQEVYDFTPHSTLAFRGQVASAGVITLPHPENSNQSLHVSIRLPYYRWRPILRGQYKQCKDEAKKNLIRVGTALAFVGGGPKKKLALKKSKKNKKASDRAWKQDHDALEYFQRAWKRCQTETQGITDPQLFEKKVQEIADKEFSQKTPAKIEAWRLYWQEAHRDTRWPK